MLNQIKTIGKCLDQPLLVGKFSKVVPASLAGLSALYTINETRKAPKGKKKKTAINTAMVLGATSLAALAAPKIAARAVGRPYEKVDLEKIKRGNTLLVENFLNNNHVGEKPKNILEKAKTKVLNIKEMSFLQKTIGKTENGKAFIDAFVPEPQNITSKEIVKDMGRLSILGALPVAGGIAGGVAADVALDRPHWKKKIPNKIKEGIYQYLANIFLCNVGAAGALGIMEAAKVKSKSARALAMVGGILVTGVIGGSSIANFIARKFVNPLFDGKKSADKCHGKHKCCDKHKDDRKPELLDICLHSDDIATVAVMSGLKWIEPALPILYTISGYRAGIGYRNGDKTCKSHHQ